MIGTGSSSDIVYLPTIAIRAPWRYAGAGHRAARHLGDPLEPERVDRPQAWPDVEPGPAHAHERGRDRERGDHAGLHAPPPGCSGAAEADDREHRERTEEQGELPRPAEPERRGDEVHESGKRCDGEDSDDARGEDDPETPARARREEPGPREPGREEHALPAAGHPSPEPERAVPHEVPRERAAEDGGERLPPSRRELDRPTPVHPVRGRVRGGDVQEERRHEEGALREPERNERGPGALRAQGEHEAAQACHPDHVHLRVRRHPERSARRDERELLAERPTLPSGQVAQKEEPGCEEPWIAREVVVPVHPEQERPWLSDREERPRSPPRPGDVRGQEEGAGEPRGPEVEPGAHVEQRERVADEPGDGRGDQIPRISEPDLPALERRPAASELPEHARPVAGEQRRASAARRAARSTWGRRRWCRTGAAG